MVVVPEKSPCSLMPKFCLSNKVGIFMPVLQEIIDLVVVILFWCLHVPVLCFFILMTGRDRVPYRMFATKWGEDSIHVGSPLSSAYSLGGKHAKVALRQ